MPMIPWADCNEEQKRQTLDWVVDTCLMWGSEIKTAFQVAATFAVGLDADDRRTTTGSDDA